MDLRKLKKLIDLVEDSGIAELEVTEVLTSGAAPTTPSALTTGST